MSEANLPENSPNPSESSPANWYSDWDTFFSTPAPAPQPTEPPASTADSTQDWQTQDWQTVDFPNAISADAIQRQGMYGGATAAAAQQGDEEATQWAARTLPPDATTADAWAENLNAETPQADVPQLLGLIQELNQCNNTLIDRVSQLEEALEMTQKALKEERERATRLAQAEDQERLATKQQLAELFNELELSHQTSQRQQMVVEALTEQLTASQEQVARLERECAIAHQRANEQASLLNQSELTCRDLRVRLQRQQRYTLQFKAALERCLEVTPLPYDLQAQTSASGQSAADPLPTLAVPPLVPKVRQIQPWSSAAETVGLPIKIDSLVGHPVDPVAEVGAESSEVQSDPSVAAAEAASLPSSEAIADSGSHAESAPNPSLEALDPGSPEFASVVEAAIQKLGLTNLANLGSAGEDLWQQLANLVDVSSEDVVKASQAEDFAAFAEQPAAAQADSEGAEERSPASAATSSTQPNSPAESAPSPVQPFGTGQSDPSVVPLRKLIDMPFEKTPAIAPVVRPAANTPAPAAATAAEQPAPLPSEEGFVPGGSWPAPVVYPFRQTKKLPSLAAVDLPTFPRT